MSVLKLKDENGKWVGIPTIKGDKGDDGTYVEGNPNGAATDGDLTKIKIDNKIYIIHNYTSAINAKQDKLVSGTNIKTVNGQSILGSGDIEIQGGSTNIPAIEITDGFSGDVTDKNSFDILMDIYNNRKFSLLYQVTTEGDYIYYSYVGQRLDNNNNGHLFYNYTDDETGTLLTIDYNAETGHWIKNEAPFLTSKTVPNNGPTDENGTNMLGVQVYTFRTGSSSVTDIVTISLVMTMSYTHDGVIQCVVPENLFGFSETHNENYTPSMFGNPAVIETLSSWMIKTLNVRWDGANTTLRFNMVQGSGSGGGIFRVNFRL